MHRFALALLAAAAFASTALALPEDGNRYHLIVVTADTPTPEGQTLLETMRRHPKASEISIRCHCHHYRTSDTLYRERYARSLPPTSLPILALANSSGGVVFKASGDALPRDGDSIYSALVAAARLDQSIPGGNAEQLGPYAYASLASYRGQCGPDGCNPNQPSPSVPDFSQPSVPNAPDGAIVDTVDVSAEGSLFRVPQWVWLAGGGGFLLLCLCGCAFVAACAFGCFWFLRR